MRLWQLARPVDPPQLVSVNLSARQLQDPDLVASVGEILEATGLSPTCLNLEITESVLMQDAGATTLRALGIERPEQAARLRALGCEQGQGYYFARPVAAEIVELDLESLDQAAA